ncbi:MAG: hypothetical protein ACKOWF_06370 [Chloroflexota bacterium]
MRPIMRALPIRRAILAGTAVTASLLLPPLAVEPVPPPAAAQDATCDYAFPRVRAWQLEQAAQAGAASGMRAAAEFGLAEQSC